MISASASSSSCVSSFTAGLSFFGTKDWIIFQQSVNVYHAILILPSSVTFLSLYSRICSSTNNLFFTVFNREDWRSTVSEAARAFAVGFRARFGRATVSFSLVASGCCCGGGNFRTGMVVGARRAFYTILAHKSQSNGNLVLKFLPDVLLFQFPCRVAVLLFPALALLLTILYQSRNRPYQALRPPLAITRVRTMVFK